MKKMFFGILFFMSFQSGIAQITAYNSSENYGADFELPKSYLNRDLENDQTPEFIINSYLMSRNYRISNDNFSKAPATIIDFVYFGQDLEGNMNYGQLGPQNISINLINSSSKNIKKITLNFTFFNEEHIQLFDNKSKSPYCTLVFSNLKGRLIKDYNDRYGFFDCYHVLSINKATSKNLFYNSDARFCALDNLKIEYEDGSVSKSASLIGKGFQSVEDFLIHSPFAPIIYCYHYLDTPKDERYKFEDDDIVVRVPSPLFQSNDDNMKKHVPPSPPDGNEIYESVVNMPTFPDGDAALIKFINNNIRYPQTALEKGIQGKVVVQFVVEKNGSIGDVKVIHSVYDELDKEAIRICKALPGFNPGSNWKGEKVRVWYTIPITFKLNVEDQIQNSWDQLFLKMFRYLRF